jgi:hypothetical protein
LLGVLKPWGLTQPPPSTASCFTSHDRSNPSFEPQFGQAYRGCSFDRRDCIHAPDIVAPDAAADAAYQSAGQMG